MEEKLEKETEEACPEGARGGTWGEGAREDCCKKGAQCLTVAEQQSAQTRLLDSGGQFRGVMGTEADCGDGHVVGEPYRDSQ